MNDEKLKNQNPTFILSDIIKRKILDMYKPSNSETLKKKISNKINNSDQNSNTKWIKGNFI